MDVNFTQSTLSLEDRSARMIPFKQTLFLGAATAIVVRALGGIYDYPPPPLPPRPSTLISWYAEEGCTAVDNNPVSRVTAVEVSI